MEDSVLLLETVGEKLNINYIDEGEGYPVVLLHGWGARAETYRFIIDTLSPYFRVIAPDMPGFGSSDEPTRAYSTEDYAQFVCDFLTSLGIDRAHFLGHSHGGRTIIKLFSEKRNISADKIVLIDSAGLIRKKSLKQKFKIVKFKIAKKLFGLAPIQKLFPDYIESLRRKNGSADYAAASPVMRQSMVKVINENLFENLSKISSPTLLIWGDRDTDTPLEHAKIMEKNIPDCGLVEIAGGNHFSFLANPPLTQRVLYSFFGVAG